MAKSPGRPIYVAAMGVAVANFLLVLFRAPTDLTLAKVATLGICLALMAARVGGLIAERRAQAIPPPDGPEADYYDPSDTI